jgi:CBS domain containing-hemolysin-like protein
MLILEIKLNSSTEQEKKYAKKIKRIINDHHWILVTLLLCNAFACEAMPILLDKLVSDIMAIVVSVTVLLLVGEIVPQALCTGPNQMKIAAFLSPFAYSLMIITYPLSFPIAKFMDLVVGKHPKTRFCNSDLKSVIELHLKEYKVDINNQQIGYFTGFLDVINTKVSELMVPIEKAYKLDYNFNINKNNLKEILDKGYNRIPIYENEQNQLIGVLLLKDLIGKDLSHPISLNKLNINILDVVKVTEDTFFLDLFEQFLEGKSKIAFVYRDISKDEELLPDYRTTIIDDKISEQDKKSEEKINVKEPLTIKDGQNVEKIEIDEPLLLNIDNDKKKDEIINENKKIKKEVKKKNHY